MSSDSSKILQFCIFPLYIWSVWANLFRCDVSMEFWCSACACPAGPALLVEKMEPSSTELCFHRCQNQLAVLVWSVSVLFLLLLTDLLVCLLLILHCFNYCSIMVIPSLKYSDVSHPFIFTIILAVPVPLLFHKHFRIIMFMSIKNSLDDLRE